MKTKKCSKCKEVKTIDNFGKNRRRKDGLHYCCRICKREEERKYREENREVLIEKSRKYREENREIINEKSRKYREENLEAALERSRKQQKDYRDMTRAMATRSGRYSLEEDLIVLDETLTVYQKAVKVGRTYGSVRSRQIKLRKKASQNA